MYTMVVCSICKINPGTLKITDGNQVSESQPRIFVNSNKVTVTFYDDDNPSTMQVRSVDSGQTFGSQEITE